MESDQNIYRHINAVVQQMGVTQGDSVPPANEENRILLKKMQHLMEQRNHKNGLHEQLVDRVSWLQEHYASSQRELQQNLRLIDAHRNQFESEQHLHKLAENEHVATKNEFDDLEKVFGQLEERDRFVENETLKLNNAIDEMSSEMHWMKHALIEWMQAMEQGNQTISLIAKYCKNDQKRADLLDSRRRKLQTDILKNAMVLSDLCDEQVSLEQMLDRTAYLYRQRHLDRRQMVDTWRDTVTAMNGRDNAIREVDEKILAARQAVTEKVAELQMQLVFLKQQVGNNREIELEQSDYNDKIARKQIQLSQLDETLQLESNEMITFKQILRNQSEKLQQLRRKNRQSIVNTEAKGKATNQLMVTCQELSDKMDRMVNHTENAQNRLKQLDELVEAEEKSLGCVEVELARLSQMLYRSKQILQQWQNEHKLVEMEIHVLETSIRSTTAQFLTQEKALSKQMEMQHDVQFKILAVEMRIKNLSGKSSEVDPDLVRKLECMEKIFGIVLAKRDCVRKQLTFTECAERKLTNKLAESSAEHKHFSEILRESQMRSESSASRLLQRRNELRERLVSHSLLKMRLHQMQSMYEKQMGKFYDLSVHKSQLQLAIDERIVDLRSQINILTLKRKHLWDERSLLMADISERLTKIDALRARFELTNEMLGKNDDGTIISVVQLKIETAQKKECLMQRGSELNESVIAAENDIQALENTLILVNYSNDQWRRNTLSNSAQEADTNKIIGSLADELATRVQKLKNIKLNIAMISEQLKESQAEFVDCENELMALSHQKFECNHALMQCHKHILEQKTKLKRAEHESKVSRKQMMQAIGDREYIRIFEKDLSVKVLEQKNRSALQQIADIVDGVRDLGPLIKKHLFDKGLQIPASSTMTMVSAMATSKHSDRSATPLSRSRASSALIGHQSECSVSIGEKSGTNSLASRSATHSSAPMSTKSTENSRKCRPPDVVGFSIDGQAIGTGKTPKQK